VHLHGNQHKNILTVPFLIHIALNMPVPLIPTLPEGKQERVILENQCNTELVSMEWLLGG
jgi:hypothetical protein